jgi:hypothetical protein
VTFCGRRGVRFPSLQLFTPHWSTFNPDFSAPGRKSLAIPAQMWPGGGRRPLRRFFPLFQKNPQRLANNPV